MSASATFFLLAVLALAAPLCHASWLAPASSATLSYAYPLSVSGSRIVDAANRTVQLRCANWPGHMETMMPEGLQYQPLPTLVKVLVQPAVYNCIRLTYSVDLFYLGANLTARQALARLQLNDTIAAVQKNNPALIDLPLLAVRDAVVAECGRAGVMVLFDNQVSRSEWCCSTTDGNGWWNDRYFNVSEWLHSLQAISTHYVKIAPNAVAYSLRNELRSDKPHAEQVADWLTYVPQGMDALHSGDPSALIFVSGLSYDTDWTFLANLTQPGTAGSHVSAAVAAAAPFDVKAWQRVYSAYAGQLVFETHIYSWSGYGTYTSDCSSILPAFDARIGYPNQQRRPHVLTEIGVNVDRFPNVQTDRDYLHCVGLWVTANRLGFGTWLFGGSYYLRDGQPNATDTFGATYANFSAYKNQWFLAALRSATWENASDAAGGGRPVGVAAENGSVGVVAGVWAGVTWVLGSWLAAVVADL